MSVWRIRRIRSARSKCASTSWPSDFGRRLGRAGYFRCGHDPRLVVHNETEVTVRADQSIEDVISSRTGNSKALERDVGRQWALISPTQNLVDPNRAHGAEEGLTGSTSRKRDHPDV